MSFLNAVLGAAQEASKLVAPAVEQGINVAGQAAGHVAGQIGPAVGGLATHVSEHILPEAGKAASAARREIGEKTIPAAAAAAQLFGHEMKDKVTPMAAVLVGEAWKRAGEAGKGAVWASGSAVAVKGVQQVLCEIPYYVIPIVVGTTVVVVAPGVIIGPLLGAVGFGAGGVGAGTIAAGAQSAIGNVATGSVFAFLQSAGAGGYGFAVLAPIVQATAACIGALAAAP